MERKGWSRKVGFYSGCKIPSFKSSVLSYLLYRTFKVRLRKVSLLPGEAISSSCRNSTALYKCVRRRFQQEACLHPADGTETDFVSALSADETKTRPISARCRDSYTWQRFSTKCRDSYTWQRLSTKCRDSYTWQRLSSTAHF